MNSIETCCTCNSKADIIYQLPLPEVYGMAKDYIQIIKMCPKCGFIFTANPFEGKILASRYKKLSGNEYDREKKEYKLSDKSDYKSRSLRQHIFIKNAIGNVNSLFEVGCASGYNLSLYKNDGTEVCGIEPSRTNVISCKKNYGIELFNGMFSDFAKMGGGMTLSFCHMY
jgi:hypothetical protein